jgi:hypothetical protein
MGPQKRSPTSFLLLLCLPQLLLCLPQLLLLLCLPQLLLLLCLLWLRFAGRCRCRSSISATVAAVIGGARVVVRKRGRAGEGASRCVQQLLQCVDYLADVGPVLWVG